MAAVTVLPVRHGNLLPRDVGTAGPGEYRVDRVRQHLFKTAGPEMIACGDRDVLAWNGTRHRARMTGRQPCPVNGCDTGHRLCRRQSG